MTSTGRSERRRGHLSTALASQGFRRLFAVRVTAQFADGVFQASLAGAVLFNPERAAQAVDVAAGFAVLLLPYSLLGPFAGVLLDRWWRQRVLVLANLARVLAVTGVAVEIALGLPGLPFYASALVVLSLSRFFNAALSAALPHVVGANELVTANALSTTAGSVATTAGGGAAIAFRVLGTQNNAAYAVTAFAAVAPYLISAAMAYGFGRSALGPGDVELGRRETVGDVARGLLAGARHLRTRRQAFLALVVVGVHRLCYGMWVVCAVLLYRNYFIGEGVLRAGLAGLAQFVTGIGIGGALAALVTPVVSRRIGLERWCGLLLAAAGVIELGCGLAFGLPAQLVGGVLLAFTAQGVKISVDTQVQRHVVDEFRGRVFAIYDTTFNLALVLAALLTALVLPADGRSAAGVVIVGAAYAATSALYLRAALRPTAVTTGAGSTTG